MITNIFIIIIIFAFFVFSFAAGYLFGNDKAAKSAAAERVRLETTYRAQFAAIKDKADADAKANVAGRTKDAQTISHLHSIISNLENKRDTVLAAFEKRKMAHLENIKKQGKEKKYKYEMERFLEFKRRVL